MTKPRQNFSARMFIAAALTLAMQSFVKSKRDFTAADEARVSLSADRAFWHSSANGGNGRGNAARHQRAAKRRRNIAARSSKRA